MELNEDWQKAVDKIRAAADEERVPRGVRGLFEDTLTADEINELVDNVRAPADGMHTEADELHEKANEIEEAASRIERFSDSVVEAADRVGEWDDSTGEDKRDAREALLEALGAVVEAWDELELDEVDVELPDDEEPPDNGIEVERVEFEHGVFYQVVLSSDADRWEIPVGADLDEANKQALKLCMVVGWPFAPLAPET